MDQAGDVIFHDGTGEKERKKGERFIVFFIFLFVGAVTYSIHPILTPGAIIPFLLLYRKGGLGIDYKPNFKVYDDRIEFPKIKQEFKFGEFDRIEIVRGGWKGRWNRILSKIAVIQGNRVTGTENNLNNKQIEKVKDMLEMRGVRVEVKGML
ncbi:MAG: hypothetical protein GF416_00835 [Candidatus Altiarchaeales archaeon]|nr:hypothetical protein [Candidatus Altiarchaeales archaeon]MBD3415663.1 hypothetical protein [Candidatus Altiarchaeales archaeon]